MQNWRENADVHLKEQHLFFPTNSYSNLEEEKAELSILLYISRHIYANSCVDESVHPKYRWHSFLSAQMKLMAPGVKSFSFRFNIEMYDVERRGKIIIIARHQTVRFGNEVFSCERKYTQHKKIARNVWEFAFESGIIRLISRTELHFRHLKSYFFQRKMWYFSNYYK